MAEEVIVNSDTSNAEEELDLELEPETTPIADDVETWKQKAAELEAKNKRLFARIKKDKEPAKTIKKPTEEVGDTGTRLSKLELLEQKRQYAWEHQLSPEETDKVFTLVAKPSKETLEDPFIKAGLTAIRSAKRVANATPSPSGRSSAFNGKSFKEMSEDERKKAFEARS